MSKFKKTKNKNKQIKIISAIFASILICMPLLSACSAGVQETQGRLSVVCTIFPQYDWVSQITAGADVEIELLLDSGVDLHSYQPTAEDIVAISNSDLFIYVGGESDEWVDEAMQSISSGGITAVNLLDVLGSQAKEEETVEGMESTEDADEDGEEAEYDEHVWLSLKNAQSFCSYIAQQLIELDPENADLYEQNAGAYIAELSELDGEYEQAVGTAERDTLLFCDRFPFRYLTDDYSLNYYAAFSGCSAETEASFETISFLAGKVDELGLSSVIILDGSDGSIAKTVIENTQSGGVRILSLNSMQSITASDVADGASYLDIMRENLEVLATALN
ncbi:MAG: metal ABC transporter substrate-binding protein [Clostridiales bacterium]|nr:metal ABC transporter substrate-binding protein [Clostridiales bacterium]